MFTLIFISMLSVATPLKYIEFVSLEGNSDCNATHCGDYPYQEKGENDGK